MTKRNRHSFGCSNTRPLGGPGTPGTPCPECDAKKKRDEPRTLKLTHNIQPIGGRGIVYPAALLDDLMRSELVNSLRVAAEQFRDDAAKMRKIPPEGVPMITHAAAQEFAKHFDQKATIAATLNEWFTNSTVFVAPDEDEPDAKGDTKLIPLTLPEFD